MYYPNGKVRSRQAAFCSFCFRSGRSSLTKDFGTQVYRMQLLGFNAVRLPFSFKDFALLGRRDYLICDPASMDDIRRSVTPPGQQLGRLV